MKVVEEVTQTNIPTISKQIRNNLNKWLRKQDNHEIVRLQEEREYSVFVNSDTEDPKSFSAHIRCLLCGITIRLQQQNKFDKTSPYLISNWCRHIKNCITISRKADNFQQSALDDFYGKKKTMVSNRQHTESM